ncbi:MAG: sugar phosphate nucleotidyltransferase [Candidatus Methylomirabilia bacterium]
MERLVQAIILAGGQGTRLHPLTLTCPKPLVPLLNIPFLHYQLAWLRRHGIREAMLACSYRVETIRQVLRDGSGLGMHLRYAVEQEPLGTAGAIRNAADLGDRLVVVLNGDVLTDMDLTAMLRFHEARGARASIFLTPVSDPTRFGLVETDLEGRVRSFLEKPTPAQVTTNTINAGVYILDPGLLQLIPRGQVISMEREFFPGLLASHIPLFGHTAEAYWLDIGNPESYRRAQVDLLAGAVATDTHPAGTRTGSLWIGEESVIPPGSRVTGPAVIGRGVRLTPDCRVEPFTVLGDGARVQNGSCLERAVLWENVDVGPGATLRDCIVADRCRIGAQAQVGPGVVLGAGTVVPAFARLPA